MVIKLKKLKNYLIHIKQNASIAMGGVFMIIIMSIFLLLVASIITLFAVFAGNLLKVLVYMFIWLICIFIALMIIKSIVDVIVLTVKYFKR